MSSSDLHVAVEILPQATRVGGGARVTRPRDGGEGGREEGSPLGGYRLVVQNGSRNSDAKSKLIIYTSHAHSQYC